MDNINARLDKFRQAINKQADADAAELTRQYEKKRSAAESERSRRSADEALAQINSEKERASAQFRKEFSRCETEQRTAVLACRNQLMEQLFSEVRQRLIEWTDTPAYTEYLKKALEKAKQEFGSNIVICARERDIPAIQGMTTLPVTADGSVILGGISARCENLFADYTLDSRLAEQKAAFPQRSELRL